MTIISIGIILYPALSTALGKKVTKVFPLVADEAVLPYVAYRQTSIVETSVKRGCGSTECTVEVAVFAASYAEMNEIAELVYATLDNQIIEDEESGMEMRSMLINSSELWNNDAFCKVLTFKCRL